jgi:hypothetical protein
MHAARMEGLSESWVEGRPELRWRSTVQPSGERERSPLG